MVAKYFGISERDTLKTWTVLETVLSVGGFVMAAVLGLFMLASHNEVGAGCVRHRIVDHTAALWSSA
jgi:hypothetical protein